MVLSDSTAIPEPAPEPHAGGSPTFEAAAPSAARLWYWSLRRELWEHRWTYIVPGIVAALFLLGFVIAAGSHSPHALALSFDFASGAVMAAYVIITVIYCLEALHGERRDRSILFWKSMPVSDWTTVLSKAAIPILLVPLFGFFVAVVTHLGVLIIALVSGGAAAHIGVGPFFQMELLMLYHFITVHALWPAPVYAWFLLVSAWSRRVPFIWAVLPPLAVFAVEKIAFNTSYLAETLGGRILGAGAPSAMEMANAFPTNPATHVTPGMYLVSPGLWIGLAITGALLFAAARLRRQQGPAY